MARVLLVDDEPAVLGLLTPLLESMGHRAVPVTSGEEAVRLAESIQFDAGVFDLRLPGITGYDAFRLIQALQPRLVAVAITGIHPDEAEPMALAAGFVSFLPKPIRREALSAALTLLLAEVPPSPARAAFEGMVGASPRMREIFDLIPRIAGTSESVLIRGETGTGKELVAQAIHRHSSRAGKPFETVDCGRGPETLLESELFGHERGAFTDASQRVIGWFEKAHGGTLFLDEIGELPFAAQAKLLGALERREITRLGGRDRIPIDVRVVAATNADLDHLVGTAFRRDLYERLRVFEMDLPPLRERGGDIRLLIDLLLPDLSRRLGVELPLVSDQAYGLFERYSWPGNVRELQNALKRAAMRCRSGVIEAGDVDSSIRKSRIPASSLVSDGGSGPFPDGMPLRERLRQARRIVAEDSVADALTRANGGVDAAARLLRVSRRTVERLRGARSRK